MRRLIFEECKKCLDWNGNRGHCASICMKPYEAMDEFNKYKDLEEQGLLLKLPCKVGDTVYIPNIDYERVFEMTVFSIQIMMSEIRIIVINGMKFVFGKEVFATKAEAEKALAEMEK